MDTDDTSSKNLQREIQRIRKGLKEWEHTFSTKYNRKPTMQDIENRPNVCKSKEKSGRGIKKRANTHHLSSL
ncbi:hypothetical protein BC940DRAFT_314169 [Gongronella butleri]|nr:hypothetical protein BC940DRAFT_314169 [Gongronella butleri]